LKGTYTLLIICVKPFRTKVGSLGYATIRKGHYLYTGSALGCGSVSLEGRLGRHLRGPKNVTWHVDYLTSNPRCRVKAIVCLRSSKRLECTINEEIVKNLSAKPILSRAGSSDCKCNGHLTRVGPSIEAGEILSKLTSVYQRFGGTVRCMQFANRTRKNAGQLNLAK
jgi:Uri superfamily endonuclease